MNKCTFIARTYWHKKHHLFGCHLSELNSIEDNQSWAGRNQQSQATLNKEWMKWICRETSMCNCSILKTWSTCDYTTPRHSNKSYPLVMSGQLFWWGNNLKLNIDGHLVPTIYSYFKHICVAHIMWACEVHMSNWPSWRLKIPLPAGIFCDEDLLQIGGFTDSNRYHQSPT